MTYPNIKTERLWIKHLSLVSADQLLDYYIRNKEFLAPTDPPHPENFYVREFWQNKIESSIKEYEEESFIRLALTDHENENRVVGSINFSQIFRGPFHACYVSYSIDGELSRKGLMFEALSRAIKYMFEERNLHRIMANHLTDNIASEKLLDKVGFVREGLAKDYLYINGKWRDHYMTSITNPDWKYEVWPS